MGQAEIMDFMLKHKDKWWSSSDIKKELKDTTSSRVGFSLKKLYYARFLERKLVSVNLKGIKEQFVYKVKGDTNGKGN
jgi:predicted transcriptional regulator